MKRFFHILSYVRPYWTYAFLNTLFNVLSIVFSLFSLTMIAPFLDILFLKQTDEYKTILSKGIPGFKLSPNSLIDNFNYYLSQVIMEKGKLNALIFIVFLVIIIFFLKNLFRYLGMYFMANVRNGVVKDLRGAMYEKILSLPLSYYSNERKGDLMSRMTTDVQEIEWSVMQSVEMVFRNPLNILILLGTMVYMSAKLTLFVLVLIPIPAILIAIVASSLRRTSRKSKTRLGLLFSMIEETLGGVRIVKAFGREKYMHDKFEQENNFYTRTMIRMYRKIDLSSPLSEFLGAGILMTLIYLGGRMVLNGALEASAFITYIAIFYQVIAPSKELTQAFYAIQRGLASAERIEKIIHADEAIKENIQPLAVSTFNKEIEYKNVSFSYTRGDSGYVLHDINLKVQKGKTIALVGQSGSGKTTLADMLPRFYDPDKGEVLIDGKSIKDISIASLRSLIGVVSQESILFNDTVFNNIAFGYNSQTGVPPQEDVMMAAKIANAHDFIMQMPDQYQTNIGDRGSKLSGGQRQRIAIARAVLKRAPILILDEATSALDSESERLVQDALNHLMENRTSIIIAHRLSTVQHADEIVVLQKGAIIERGNHMQLIAQNGVYKKLYDTQSFMS